jgi:hypothetical protein
MPYPDYDPTEYEQFGVLEALDGFIYERATGTVKRNGIWEFDQPLICRFGTFMGLNHGVSVSTVLPADGDAHPLTTWALAQETRWEQLKGDWCRVVTHYAGSPGDGPIINRNRTQGRTEPIITSPKIDYVLGWVSNFSNAVANGWDGVTYDSQGYPAHTVIWDTDADGNKVVKSFGKNAARYQGVESYETGGAIHSVNYYSSSHSDRWPMFKKIDVPRGDPPPIPDGANWMLDDIQEDEKGDGYEITETWKCSEALAPFDPIIYGDATS